MTEETELTEDPNPLQVASVSTVSGNYRTIDRRPATAADLWIGYCDKRKQAVIRRNEPTEIPVWIVELEPAGKGLVK